MKTSFKPNDKDIHTRKGILPRLLIAAIGIALLFGGCKSSITEVINGSKPPVLTELYFTLDDGTGTASESENNSGLDLLDGITGTAIDGMNIETDIEEYKVKLPKGYGQKVRICVKVSGGEVDTITGHDEVFNPSEVKYSTIMVKSNNWPTKVYRIKYEKPAETDPVTYTDTKGTAVINGIALSPGIAPEVEGGVFKDSGSEIAIVYLPAGTTEQITVSVQVGSGVSVVCNPPLEAGNKLTIKDGGLTYLYITAKEGGKKDGIYTVIFSVERTTQPEQVVQGGQSGRSGYEGDLVAIYADTTIDNGIMKRNANGDFVLDGMPKNKIIHTIKTDDASGAKEYLLGRIDYEPVTLNLDENGDLQFALPLNYGTNRGCIPVESVAELNKINTGVASLGGRYTLTANVDLLGNPNDDADYYNRRSWQPIGKDTTGFTGVFDGGGYIISGLSIKTGDTAAGSGNNGFFAQIGDGTATGVTVRNVIIEGKIDVTINETGGVAGQVLNATLKNCENRAQITGVANTGGVAGDVGVGASVTGCYNTGAVDGGDYTGGVAGLVNGGTVTDCYNTGEVRGSGDNTGGVAGYVSGGGTVTDCYNTGAVYGSYYTGGVAGGVVDGSVTACYNIGAVDGGITTGGVAGHVSGGGTVTGCYNTGAVTGTTYCTGGVAGEVKHGSVTGCYNTGEVDGGNNTGGVAGDVGYSSYISACYNTGAVDGGEQTGGIVGGLGGGSALTACYNSGEVTGGSATGGVAGQVVASTVTACCWDSSVTGAPASGIGDPASDTDAEPFNGTADFPNVSGGNVEWGTGNGSGSGKYWKAGTTGGGRLPKLWFE